MNNPQKVKISSIRGNKRGVYEVVLSWYGPDINPKNNKLKRNQTTHYLKDKDGNNIPYKSGSKTERNKYNVNILAEQWRVFEEEKRFPSGAMLFLSFLDKFEEHENKRVERGEIRPITRDGYISVLNANIRPYFKDKNLKLNEVSKANINNFYDYLFDVKKLHSIKHITKTLKLIFNLAEDLDLITKSPVPKRRKLTSESNENRVKKHCLDEEEMAKVLEITKGTYLYSILHIGFYYGLRPSEILGLRWQDIDLKNKTIHICFTAVKSSSGLYCAEKTKTEDSNRTLPILDETVQIFKAIKTEQEENKRLYANCYHKEEQDFVFRQKNGKPYLPSSLHRKLNKMLTDNVLEPMRLYDMRPTACTRMRQKGFDAKLRAKWLGHTKTDITENVYTHVTQAEVNNSFNQLL